MKIKALVENTSINAELGSEHGLSIHIETQGKTVLFDTGASSLFAENAKKMGVDLQKIDLVFLSHGHYDHAGGLPTFLEINKDAPIYLRNSAFGDYYSERDGGAYEYIGIDKHLLTSNRIVFTPEHMSLGKGLSLYSQVQGNRFFPTGNASLFKKTEEGLVRDDFTHEQNLVIEEGEVSLLVSGCSHRGIVNIVDKFFELYGHYPTHVIGGFHLYNHRTGKPESRETLEKISEALLATGAMYHTCHCTGEANYEMLRTLMGEKIAYLSGGTCLDIETKEKN